MSSSKEYTEMKGKLAGILFLLLLMWAPGLQLRSVSAVHWCYVYDEAWKWTPYLQVHAPRHGEAEGTIAWSTDRKFVVNVGIGVESHVSSSVTLYPEDGTCAARFQLCLWRYGYDCVLGEDVVAIVDKREWHVTIDIYGNSRDTCEDDLESVSHAGYSSISFKTQYTSCDRIEDTRATSVWTEVQVSVSVGAVLSLGPISLTIGDYGPFSGSFEMKSTVSMSWKYRFPPGYMWCIDYLGNNEYSVWAFKLLS